MHNTLLIAAITVYPYFAVGRTWSHLHEGIHGSLEVSKDSDSLPGLTSCGAFPELGYNYSAVVTVTQNCTFGLRNNPTCSAAGCSLYVRSGNCSSANFTTGDIFRITDNPADNRLAIPQCPCRGIEDLTGTGATSSSKRICGGEAIWKYAWDNGVGTKADYGLAVSLKSMVVSIRTCEKCVT
jgi:hypothetical protein